MPEHVCIPDQWGICTDENRDWCPECSTCSEWDGDRCRSCNRTWGGE